MFCTILALALGLSGLYYFRYYYAAPPKTQLHGHEDHKSATESGFDLHPDVSRSSRGIGFPTDFLNMFMKSISIFGYIEEPVFHEFSRQLQTRRLLAGERMFDNDGDRDDQNFYVVIDGQVQIYLVDQADGQEAHAGEVDGEPAGSAILLNEIGPGDVLSSLFSILSLFTEGVPLRQHVHDDLPAGNHADSRGGDQVSAVDTSGVLRSIHLQDTARPNVIARATTDTTLAMIPANAFQRVTRLYPKAAAHILQVILTRLQRVTFATLYDYLDVPHELVAVERNIGELAKYSIDAGKALQAIKGIYGSSSAEQTSRATAQSPLLNASRAGTGNDLPSYSHRFGATAGLQASWKISHAMLSALAKQVTQKPPMENEPEASLELPEAAKITRKNSTQDHSPRHRRAGSDSIPLGGVPSGESIEQLRKDALHMLCLSIGLNPDTADGRYPQANTERQALTPTGTMSPVAHSSTPTSRRSSTHRKLPRTEHFLPLLQSINLPASQQRAASGTPPLPLSEIPSLANELELYCVPDNFALVEQGERPAGLFIVLDGTVEVTPRRSAAGFARQPGYGAQGAPQGTEQRGLPQENATKTYRLGAGDLVGYLPALTDMASFCTARARGRVIVGMVSRWALDRICERYPIILMTLARRITSQLPPVVLNIDYALEWAHVRAGEMVYRRGEMSDAVYLVITGRLRAFVEKDNGSISILAEYGQGQSIGEPGLLLNEPCSSNLHAIRDTELVRIPTALFKALMRTAPSLTFHLSRALAVRTAQSLQSHQLMEQQRSRLADAMGSHGGEGGMRSHNKNLKSIGIIPVSNDVPVHVFAQQLEHALRSVAGSVALLDHTAVSRVLGRHAFGRMARLKTMSWIAELEQRCRLLLHVADGGISSPWTRHCVRHADFILLVGVGDGDSSVGDYERLLLSLKTTARKELVLLHETRSCPTGSTREWLRLRPWVHAHHHVQMPLGVLDMEGDMEVTRRHIRILKSRIEHYYNALKHSDPYARKTLHGPRSDFARLARYLCGKSVGVVMSGGGARGMALLGVLQAFEESGIPVDMVGGTSIGAFVSGLYAQSPDTVSIHGPAKAFARRMSSTWRFLLDVTYPILAYTSGREFNRAIWKVFRDAEIEDLWLPFYCITANITRSRPEVHIAGLLWRVVRASMSLSGFLPPLCDANGDLLVDGGYLDNLPVRAMQSELGADMIFAIDIAGENDSSPVRYGESVSGLGVLLNHLNPFRKYWIPTLSEVQTRLTYSSSDKELESAKANSGCVYLRVPPRDVGVLDFGRFDELHRRGYQYAKLWISEWQREGLLGLWQEDRGAAGAGNSLSTSHSEGATPKALKLARRNSI
ncbi:patatin-domain-containing protein [Linderina pennispora]|uniref:Lysophospholipase NTE1 n=1 Tax=Linderina pennispora TaxID=61395 RepID=A0A1Y1WMR2_9FUNG|nr:patatin-domain-containing protein [Linderina pennispora]ORX74762.1 patatin-domain-containing protein [Linderina pennispora]